MKPLTIRICIIAFVAGAVSFTANEARAECESVRCVDPIKKLYQRQDELRIDTAGNEENLSCDTANGYILLRPSHPAYEEIHRMLLAAFLSGRTVNLRTNSSGTCAVGYVVLDDDL